jgi:hypothetical protein
MGELCEQIQAYDVWVWRKRYAGRKVQQKTRDGDVELCRELWPSGEVTLEMSHKAVWASGRIVRI